MTVSALRSPARETDRKAKAARAVGARAALALSVRLMLTSQRIVAVHTSLQSAGPSISSTMLER